MFERQVRRVWVSEPEELLSLSVAFGELPDRKGRAAAELGVVHKEAGGVGSGV